MERRKFIAIIPALWNGLIASTQEAPKFGRAFNIYGNSELMKIESDKFREKMAPYAPHYPGQVVVIGNETTTFF